jgi:hypothetical protein
MELFPGTAFPGEKNDAVQKGPPRAGLFVQSSYQLLAGGVK